MESRTTWDIFFLGNSATGKTSIIRRFLTKDFIDDYVPTTENEILNDKKLEGKSVSIKFKDSPGTKSKLNLQQTVTDNSAFIIVFDLSKKESFIPVVGWISEIEMMKRNFPIILVGNKKDIYPNVIDQTVKFTFEHEKYQKVKYFKTSAKDGIGIKKLLKAIINITGNSDVLYELKIEDKKRSRNEPKKRKTMEKLIFKPKCRLFEGDDQNHNLDCSSTQLPGTSAPKFSRKTIRPQENLPIHIPPRNKAVSQSNKQSESLFENDDLIEQPIPNPTNEMTNMHFYFDQRRPSAPGVYPIKTQ